MNGHSNLFSLNLIEFRFSKREMPIFSSLKEIRKETPKETRKETPKQIRKEESSRPALFAFTMQPLDCS